MGVRVVLVLALMFSISSGVSITSLEQDTSKKEKKMADVNCCTRLCNIIFLGLVRKRITTVFLRNWRTLGWSLVELDVRALSRAKFDMLKTCGRVQCSVCF